MLNPVVFKPFEVAMRKMSFVLVAMVVTILFFPIGVSVAQQPVADIDLNPENYVRWRDQILPSEDELIFLKIPWKTTFKDGVIAANESGKPVLLWTMNGHPLGCT